MNSVTMIETPKGAVAVFGDKDVYEIAEEFVSKDFADYIRALHADLDCYEDMYDANEELRRKVEELETKIKQLEKNQNKKQQNKLF